MTNKTFIVKLPEGETTKEIELENGSVVVLSEGALYQNETLYKLVPEYFIVKVNNKIVEETTVKAEKEKKPKKAKKEKKEKVVEESTEELLTEAPTEVEVVIEEEEA